MTETTATPQIRFGTDGWRALIAEDYTFDNVRVCAQAVAAHMKAEGSAGRGIVVGWDTRFGSDRFAAAVAEVMAGNDIRTWLFDRPAPTPACSYALTQRTAGAGVMITASHNSGAWNGFKVKSELGGSASPEAVAQIEGRIDAIIDAREGVRRIPLHEAVESGTVSYIDPSRPYLEQLGRVVDIDPIRKAPLKVVVDSMYGAGGGLIPRVLGGGDIEVVEINGSPNPAFPGIKQPEPVAENLGRLMAAVPEMRADVGIALDGDADRVGIVDETGRYMTTLEVFSLLAHHMLDRRQETGDIISTITMSSMVDKLGEQFGVATHRTSVGFKYVGPKMLETDAVLGGEESGGYAFRGHLPERDGILSGLLFLEAMVLSGSRPSRLLAELHDLVGRHTFRRLDLTFPPEDRDVLQNRLDDAAPGRLGNFEVTSVERTDGARFLLDGGWWGIARFSGTEPLVRIYAEGPDEDQVDAILTGLKEMVGL